MRLGFQLNPAQNFYFHAGLLLILGAPCPLLSKWPRVWVSVPLELREPHCVSHQLALRDNLEISFD